MLDMQLGFRLTQNGGNAPDDRTIVAALQPALLLGGSWYLGPNLSVEMLDVGGNVTTSWAWGGAVGFRYLPLPFLALRVEGRYRQWSTANIDEVGVAVAMGVVLN